LEPTGIHSPRYAATAGAVWLIATAFIVSLLMAIYMHRPPMVVSDAAPPTLFSADRAMVHVDALAKAPRTPGNPALETAREYIRKDLRRYDLRTPDAEDAPEGESDPIQNIAVRFEGLDSTKAVLLMAHYDSVPDGPGAADDAAGVAVLLETLRVIKSHERLRNDIIFLFTDAEEQGMLGAKKFIESHPWKDDIGVALNFDARGSAGPVYMSNASEDNGWLIGHLSKGTRHIIANSLMPEVRQHMPNKTDLDLFIEQGIPAMDFNNIDDAPRYHTLLDIPEALQRGTVQHMGEYASSLALYLGKRDLSAPKSSKEHYFTLIGPIFFHYAAWLDYLLILIAIAAYGAMFYTGQRNGHISLIQTLAGLIVYAIIGGAVCALSYWLMKEFQTLHGEDINWVMTMYLGFFSALAVALFAFLLSVSRAWLRAQDLAMGALLVWVIGLCVLIFYAPGGIPLFVWPLLAAMIPLSIHFAVDDFEVVGTGPGVGFGLAIVPPILILAPNVIAFNIAMGLDKMHLTILFVVLLAGLMIPQIAMFAAKRSMAIPIVSIIVANVFLIGGLALAEPRAKEARRQAEPYRALITQELLPATAPRESNPPINTADIPNQSPLVKPSNDTGE
jgi:hypothetical protein